MENQYFVLYKRDRSGETMEKAKGRMLYDKIEEFVDRDEAAAFALSNLQDTPIMARYVKAFADHDSNISYVVAAHFEHKYQHYDYGGDSDSVPTHEVERCGQNHLDSIVETMASESPNKMYLGIEEKLLPTALNRINSVNNPEHRNRDYNI